MRAQRQLTAKRLLDSRLHGLFVAGMPTTGDVHRRERGHQRFLGAVGNCLRQFTHIAIEVDGLHSS